MSIAIITGSAGLIGSQTAQFFHNKGFEIIGIDNDMRAYFFGKNGSTIETERFLKNSIKNYHHFKIDIRDKDGIFSLFKKLKKNIKVIVHLLHV